MTNFVFISPHFPTNYWQFCRALKDTGVNVLGIADMPYDQLPAHVQGALTDYYHVPSLEDGDAVLKAVGWFTHRWGKIDWLESNNEYWLEQDAWLRTMFHITTGPQMEQMELYKRKSAMKEGYRRAGVPVAKWRLADTLAQAQAFAEQVGYPIVAKPDTGVGASNMYRIQDENDLRAFFAKKPLIPYILEQYVNGGICSYDALIDSQGNPLYETGNLTSGSLMDVVNHQLDSVFMIVPEVAEDLREIGRRTVKAFNVKSRLVHFEFFRLHEDQDGLGKKGDIIALEVNMRPSGGVTPDMINYAGSIDIYRLWADMVMHDRIWLDPDRQKYYCVFVGRRDNHVYRHSHYDVMNEYRHRIVMQERLPQALSGAMGNDLYLARCINKEEADEFVRYVCQPIG